MTLTFFFLKHWRKLWKRGKTFSQHCVKCVRVWIKWDAKSGEKVKICFLEQPCLASEAHRCMWTAALWEQIQDMFEDLISCGDAVKLCLVLMCLGVCVWAFSDVIGQVFWTPAREEESASNLFVCAYRNESNDQNRQEKNSVVHLATSLPKFPPPASSFILPFLSSSFFFLKSTDQLLALLTLFTFVCTPDF